MPTICAFYGIVISMYYDDHQPRHFHARSAGQEAQIGIDTLALMRGDLPPRARRRTLEWARLHQAELRESWERMRRDESPLRIDPLP